MGACMSSGGVDVSEEDKRLHREAEKSLKEVRHYLHLLTGYTAPDSPSVAMQAKLKLQKQVKVRLYSLAPSSC